MSKIAYFDCPTGLAGDMCLGALSHAGVPLTYLQSQLAKLGIKQEYSLSLVSVQRNQQAATKFHVQLTESSATKETTEDSQEQSHTDRHNYDYDHNHADAHVHGQDIHRHHDAHSHGHAHSHAHSHAHRQGHSHRHAHSDADAYGDAHSHRHVHGHSQPHAHRNLKDIQQLIRQAHLPARAEAWSLAVFQNLAIAEATVHGTTMDEVHFHEVGAVDAIVDIVGTCLGLDYLDVDEIVCSPLPTGGGTVWAAHGRLPVPAPAVLKLFAMGQVPVYGNGIERELVTPTGAAIAITLAKHFGPPPPMHLQTIGLGAGTIDLPIPNMVRLWIGESELQSHSNPVHHSSTHDDATSQPQPVTADSAPVTQQLAKLSPSDDDKTPVNITLLQTQLDDLSPQAIGYTFDLLLEAGALDVFTQAISMKKNRPGVLLTVICPDERIVDCETILFRETSTLGIRRQPQQRSILQRHWQTVTTAYGPIRIKVADSVTADLAQGDLAQGNPEHMPLNVQPEYEDCAAIARAHNLPWHDVHQLALQAWHQSQI